MIDAVNRGAGRRVFNTLLIASTLLGCEPRERVEETRDRPPGYGPPEAWCDALPVEGVEGAIAVSSHDHGATCAVVKPGRVWCWGEGVWPTADVDVSAEPRPTPLPSLGDDVHDVVLGMDETCTIHRNGEVRCWGRGQQPTLLELPSAARQIIIDPETWVLTRDGRVFVVQGFETREVSFGRAPVHSLVGAEPEFDDWTVAVIAGDERRLVVNQPAPHLLGLEFPVSPIDRALLRDGFYRGCVVVSGRGLGCWNLRDLHMYPALYRYVDAIPVRFKPEHSDVSDVAIVIRTLCFLRSNGEFVCEHDDELPHPRLDGVLSMTGSSWHGCVIRDDERVWCWGIAEHGVLGHSAATGDADPSGTQRRCSTAVVSR